MHIKCFNTHTHTQTHTTHTHTHTKLMINESLYQKNNINIEQNKMVREL